MKLTFADESDFISKICKLSLTETYLSIRHLACDNLYKDIKLYIFGAKSEFFLWAPPE